MRGLVTSEMVASDNNRLARLYTLTASGRAQLEPRRPIGSSSFSRCAGYFARRRCAQVRTPDHPGRQVLRVDTLVARLRALAGRRRIDTEVDAELRFHVQMETDANVAAGMPPEEARRVAMRDLGGLTQTMESVRTVRETVFDALARDVRIAARMLVRSPFVCASRWSRRWRSALVRMPRSSASSMPS